MKIVVFGADNIIGHLVIEKALRSNHEVIAFVNKKNVFTMTHPELQVKVGSLYNKEDIKEVLVGADAVLSTLKPKRSIRRKVMAMPVADAHQLIMESMEELNVRRFITLGSTTISAEEDVHQIATVLPRKMAKLFYPNTYQEMQQINHLLTSSSLDWTVVRAIKTKEQVNEDGYKLSFGDTEGKLNVSTSNVAQCLLDAIGKQVWYKKMPIVFNRK